MIKKVKAQERMIPSVASGLVQQKCLKVHPFEDILLTLRTFFKINKPATKGQTLCDSTYMRCKEKSLETESRRAVAMGRSQ